MIPRCCASAVRRSRRGAITECSRGFSPHRRRRSSGDGEVVHVVRASRRRAELTMECAHGLGHGFTEAMGYDLSRALGGVRHVRGDGPARRMPRRRVHGERGARCRREGNERRRQRDGGARPHGDEHGFGAVHRSFRASPISRFPCDSVAAQYQPSCWSYQPLVIARLRDYDVERTLKDCSLAPSSSASNCYRGFGKQSQAFFVWNRAKVIGTCSGRARLRQTVSRGGRSARRSRPRRRARSTSAAVPAETRRSASRQSASESRRYTPTTRAPSTSARWRGARVRGRMRPRLPLSRLLRGSAPRRPPGVPSLDELKDRAGVLAEERLAAQGDRDPPAPVRSTRTPDSRWAGRTLAVQSATRSSSSALSAIDSARASD